MRARGVKERPVRRRACLHGRAADAGANGAPKSPRDLSFRRLTALSDATNFAAIRLTNPPAMDR